MPYPDSVDVGQQVWGGYNSSISPANLPAGSSPYNQDCMFPEGAVRTRDGLSPVYPSTDFTGGTVQGAAGYVNNTLPNPTLAVFLDILGNVYLAAGSTALSLLANTIQENCLLSAAQIFQRIYTSIGNQSGGTDFPRQYDGTYYDRVTQCGPGGGVSVADNTNPQDNVSLTQYSSVIGAISEVGNIVTLIPSTQTLPGTTATINDAIQNGDPITISGTVQYNGLWAATGVVQVGAGLYGIQFYNPTTGLTAESTGTVDTGITEMVASFNFPVQTNQNGVDLNVTITGATPADYNGTWPIRWSVPNESTIQAWISVATTGLANARGANAGESPQVGQISAGPHQVAVCFITRQQAILKPCPPVTWIAGGSLTAIVTIPKGPSNIIQRLVIVTPVLVPPETTGNFYSIETGSIYAKAMLVQDNITGLVEIDFSDSNLISGFNAQYLFNANELGESFGTTSYSSRGVWVQEQNKIQNLLNLEFNGGWNIGGGTGGSDVPLGWTSDPTYGAGGSRVANGGMWLDAFQITGAGATAAHGMITQPAYQDWLGTTIFAPLTSYSVRLRAYTSANVTLIVDLFSPTAGILSQCTFTINTSAGYVETIVPFGATLPTTIPPDTLLRLYVSGAFANGATLMIDSIEPYPTNTPINSSVARISYANQPEGFDGVTGQVQVRPGDGQQLRACFTIRGNLYLAKDRYMGYVVDDGQNEPSFWQFVETSDGIGICGPDAVDVTEEWACFANRSGLYVFWGGDPIKISQEIQEDASQTGKPCWNSINWSAGAAVWVRIDEQNKRILVGVPMGADQTTVNLVWQIDYRFTGGGPGIAEASGAAYGAFQPSVLLEHGAGRKYSPWSISGNCCALIEQQNGTVETWMGGEFGVSWLKPYNYNDNGESIDTIYQLAATPEMQQEQMLQLRSHRHFIDYIAGHVFGQGTMQMSLITPYRTTPVRAVSLSSNPVDFERNVDVHAERVFIEVSGDGTAGDWFQLDRMIPMLKPDPTMPVRGVGP